MRNIAIGLLSLAVTAAYWPGISGAATSSRWIVLMIGAPLLLFFTGRIQWTLSHLGGALFVLWCLMTLAWTPQLDDGLGDAIHLIVLAAVFALGSTVKDTRPLYIGAAVGMALSGIVVSAEYLGLLALPSYGSRAGLFFNANTMGETAALVVIACLASRLWWCAAIAAPALIFSNARGPLLALIVTGIVVAWWLFKRARMPAVAAIVALAMIVAGFIAVPFAERATSSKRFAIWSDTAHAITVTGHGLGSFWAKFPDVAYKTDMSVERVARAHNEPLDIAFETGVIGLVLFVAFALTLIGPVTPERLVLVAVAVEACFAFPLHNPAAGFLAMVVAGHVARDRGHAVDEACARRGQLRAWLARRRFSTGIG
jgi:O-antigen ligase